MQTVIIRFSIVFFTAAVACFALALSLNLLAMKRFADLAGYMGVLLLLCAFCIFLAYGLCATAKLILHTIMAYFDRSRRLERALLYNVSRWDRLNRLFYFQKAKINYVNRQKRKSLSEKLERQADYPFSPEKKPPPVVRALSCPAINVTKRHHD